MSTESDDTSKPVRPNKRKPPSIDDLKVVNISSGVKSVEGATTKPNGSSVKPSYKHRTICYYPVTDDELGQIATFNRVSAALFATGSFLLGLSVDVAKDILTTQDLETALKSAMTAASISTAVVCLICYGLGIFFWRLKSAQTNRIKTESVDDL